MCDHTGDYKIYTRMVGYTPVKVYLCHRCGANMAMDTLPQYLLRRMWGDLKQHLVPSVQLPPVDVCVVFCGKLALRCAKVMMSSFLRTVTTVSGLTFHFVNQDLPDAEFNSIIDLYPGCKHYWRPPIPHNVRRGPGSIANQRPYGLVDAEWSDDWMVKNCGTNQWVALLHFDLFFCADFLTFLRLIANKYIGMLGQQCPFVMVNREAYEQSTFGFRTAGPFSLVSHPEQPDQLWMYDQNDTRAFNLDPRSRVYRTSFDTGELLELELRTYGWQCYPQREYFNDYFYHFAGAGHANEEQTKDIERRLQMFEEEYGV